MSETEKIDRRRGPRGVRPVTSPRALAAAEIGAQSALVAGCGAPSCGPSVCRACLERAWRSAIAALVSIADP